MWKDHATEDWPWFEPRATYENARLSKNNGAPVLVASWEIKRTFCLIIATPI